MKPLDKMPRSIARSTCPLCGHILPHWRLHKHIRSEHWRMRKEIMVEIQNEHPAWDDQNGTCKRCWESYQGVVRVVRFMNKFKFPKHWKRGVEVTGYQYSGE